jgi:hypothetical protein
MLEIQGDGAASGPVEGAVGERERFAGGRTGPGGPGTRSLWSGRGVVALARSTGCGCCVSWMGARMSRVESVVAEGVSIGEGFPGRRLENLTVDNGQNPATFAAHNANTSKQLLLS